MVLPEASDEALRVSVNPSCLAASATRWRVFGRTVSMPRRARDTVESETPAARATSCRVLIGPSL